MGAILGEQHKSRNGFAFNTPRQTPFDASHHVAAWDALTWIEGPHHSQNQ